MPGKRRCGQSDRGEDRDEGFLHDVDKAEITEFCLRDYGQGKRCDPQQRIFLELAWEAMERSGYTPETHTQRRTGPTNRYLLALHHAKCVAVERWDIVAVSDLHRWSMPRSPRESMRMGIQNTPAVELESVQCGAR